MEFASQLQDNLSSLAYFVPELILAGVMLLLMIGDIALKPQRSSYLGFVALAGTVIALLAVIAQYALDDRLIFNGMMAMDRFSLFFKLLFVASTAMVILLSMSSIELSGRRVGEYFILLIATTLGMFWMASSTNLITIFISIETVSIASFALATYLKSVKRSSEAGLKYTIYGAFSSGLMLYGISLLYGLTGTLNIYEISKILAAGSPLPLTLFVAVLLITAGFGYKIASVPFHFWAPDVYEGAPTPITAFFSVGPKAAGFAMLLRFFNSGLATPASPDGTEWYAVANLNWPQLLSVIAAATMTLGNLVAIVQNNVKRLLAYSSIAHAGYTLMGAVLLTKEGVFATMFYLVVYYLMNLGAFLVVIVFQQLVGSERIQDYRGLGFRAPAVAVAMTIFLFSLTGIPLTAGFIGKFYLFAALIKGGSQYYWLVIVAGLNSVVSLYYYARIIKAMWLEKSEEELPELPVSMAAVVLVFVLAAPTIIFGLYWTWLSKLTDYSVKMFSSL
jgi:NADH-quinone oxidoreductase subunit N